MNSYWPPNSKKVQMFLVCAEIIKLLYLVLLMLKSPSYFIDCVYIWLGCLLKCNLAVLAFKDLFGILWKFNIINMTKKTTKQHHAMTDLPNKNSK